MALLAIFALVVTLSYLSGSRAFGIHYSAPAHHEIVPGRPRQVGSRPRHQRSDKRSARLWPDNPGWAPPALQIPGNAFTDGSYQRVELFARGGVDPLKSQLTIAFAQKDTNNNSCAQCRIFTDQTLCRWYSDPSCLPPQLCVVENPADTMAIDRANDYQARS